MPVDLLFEIVMGFLATLSDTLTEPTAEHSGLKPKLLVGVLVTMGCLLAAAIVYELLT